MRLAAATALAFASLLAAAPSAFSAAEVDTGNGALGAEILARVNAVRVASGVAPLHPSQQLAQAAGAHSREMLERGYFDHSSADGTSFDDRIRRYYHPGGRADVGENLLWASPSIDATAAVEMWLGSPRHRENLLSPRWREFGVGAAHATSAPGEFDGLEVTVVTMTFGVAATPAPATAVKPVEPRAASPAPPTDSADSSARTREAARPDRATPRRRAASFPARLLAALSQVASATPRQPRERWAARG